MSPLDRLALRELDSTTEACDLTLRARGLIRHDRAEAVRLLRRALAVLSPRPCVAGVLLDAEEPLSCREIAAALGWPQSTVRLDLRTMIERGQVRVIGKGGGTTYTVRRGLQVSA